MTNQIIVSGWLLLLGIVGNTHGQARLPAVQTTYKDGVSTVAMDPLRISGERDQFYSLHLALSFRYEGEEPKPPNAVEVQIQTVVKGQRLNSDLNIQFIADAEKIFLSSNRWAVRDPIPGRRMIGERIEMRMPVATFLKLSSANYAAIQMGKTTFVLGKEQKRALKEFAKRMSVSGARLSTRQSTSSLPRQISPGQLSCVPTRAGYPGTLSRQVFASGPSSCPHPEPGP
jgi:hypothetical protein